jgi:Protein of unknown function (DUF1479)
MADQPPDLSAEIAAAKAKLRQGLPNYGSVFADMVQMLGREADEIAARHADGDPIVPRVAYSDIVAGTVPADVPAAIRRYGCTVVSGVFPRAQAEAWDAELLDYVQSNHYIEKAKAKGNLDKYFSTLKSGKPQIYGIYWSRPQMQARQDASMATARAWLNRLWTWEKDARQFFNPDRNYNYADRIRQREPGDATLGLSPHMDGGSVERWLDPSFHHVYRRVFDGNWQSHDPWNGEGRPETREIPSPAVCRMFRTYQGWTALTEQGPGDGTLQLLPMANAMSYMLLRALQDDVPEDELCGAAPGRALRMNEQYHAPLLRALIPVPKVQAGDTVWWHPDVVHAVEDENRGRGYSSVIYIGAAPDCAKNREFLPLQKAAFLAGRSSPDFAAEDYEVDFEGRATETDLTPLGRRQMGFDPW